MSSNDSSPSACEQAALRNHIETFNDHWLHQLTWRLLLVDGEVARYRVTSPSSARDWLITRPAALASDNVFRRVNHEFELRDLLEPAWAVMPVALLASSDGPLLVLDQQGGCLLHDLVSDTLSISRFLRLAIGAAHAVDQAHAHGILHRDIKPCNLIEGEDGVVRLTAFALAVHQTRSLCAAVESISGSLAYMSPEQAGRVGHQADERSDLYSLGVTFYELLTGRLPFEGNDPVEWLHQHVALQPLPPEHWRQAIPAPLGRLVLKLLAKNPADRYQCASSLEADLRFCLADWSDFRRIRNFEPGGPPSHGTDPLASQLIARTDELTVLHDCVARVVQLGGCELVLLSGAAGVGKSALVRQLHQELAGNRVLFASGRFEQHQRTLPYASLTRALRSLILRILGEDPLELARWRERLLELLGDDGRLIANLVPEIEWVTGDFPVLNEMPPHDAQDRFHGALLRLIQVFASAQCPLILFFDDLQWLDNDTLAFLAAVGSSTLQYLVLIAAYRDEPADYSQAFVSFLSNLHQCQQRKTPLNLQPLDVAGVALIVGAALNDDAQSLELLVRILYDKTAGNPFFVHQLLQTLLDERLIDQARDGHGWTWDPVRIAEFPVAENVIELMVARISRLPANTRHLLSLLALAGSRADEAELACFSDLDVASVRLALAPAIESKLLIEEQGGLLFSHDRVREAAYSLIPEELRPGGHARMARRLIETLSPDELQSALFRVALHIQQSGGEALEEADKQLFIGVLLQAAHKAKDTAAVSFALQYLQLAQRLGGEKRWQQYYARNYDIDFLQAQCLIYTAEYAQADQRIGRLLERVLSLNEVSSLYVLKVELLSLSGDTSAAVQAGIQGLGLFGIDITGPEGGDDVHSAYARLKATLGTRSIVSLADLGPLQNSFIKAAVELLASMISPASVTDEKLLFLLLCRMVQLTLKHGVTDASPMGLAWFGVVLAQRFEAYREGLEYADVAYDIVVRQGYVNSEATTLIALDKVSVWTRPLEFSLSCAEKALKASRSEGDPSMACHANNQIISNSLVMGAPLARIEKQIEVGTLLSRQHNFRFSQDMLNAVAGFVRMLRGSGQGTEADHAACLALEAQSRSSSMVPAKFRWWLFKGIKNVLFRNFNAAHQSLQEAARYSWSTPSHIHLMELALFRALTAAALCEPSVNLAASLAVIEPEVEQLRRWAELNPGTFRDKLLLVEAEIARIEGRTLDAMTLYDSAIRQAVIAGFIHVQALAHELAGRCYETQGLMTAARSHLRCARDAYHRWGATRKVQDLELRHLYLHDQPASSRSSIDLAEGQQYLDMLSVIKASQALSREIVFDRLIDLLMTNTLVHAGARRGVLVLLRDGVPTIAATGQVKEGGIEVGMASAAADSTQLPLSLLYTVLRTRQSIALDQASADEMFAADEFFQRHPARSVLCLPLLKQGDVIGALYLENPLASGVFTHGRISVIELLAAQAAISLETSRLYAELIAENARRSDTEAALRIARTELAHVSQATIMGELAASIAHEINQPLVSIVSNASASVRWLRREVPEVQEALEGLEDISKDGKRAADIVYALQTLAKQKPANCRKLLIDDVIRQVLMLTASEIEHKHVAVRVDLNASNMRVYTDSVQMQQVVLNLMMNAVDAMLAVDEGNRRLTVTSSVQNDDRVVVTIEDTGPGVSAENADKIFNAFFTTKTTGMGMGLAICRSIMNAQSGTLHCLPGRTGGTVFVFTLPGVERVG
ncbi:MAG: fixL 2 [Pseudomonas sp.]|nr:fixL 2 [Pseudomonas sp.]